METCIICMDSEAAVERDWWSCCECSAVAHWKCLHAWYSRGVGCPQCRACHVSAALARLRVDVPSATNGLERLALLRLVVTLTALRGIDATEGERGKADDDQEHAEDEWALVAPHLVQ